MCAGFLSAGDKIGAALLMHPDAYFCQQISEIPAECERNTLQMG